MTNAEFETAMRLIAVLFLLGFILVGGWFALSLGDKWQYLRNKWRLRQRN